MTTTPPNNSQLDIEIVPSGDRAVTVYLGNSIDPQTSQRVLSLVKNLDDQRSKNILDIVPAYASVLILYNPLKISMSDLSIMIEKAASHQGTVKESTGKMLEIPVLYGGEYGPDMNFIEECTQFSEKEIISIHSKTLYRAYMIGFTPGFPYLGTLDSKLHIPRRKTPRNAIPEGSVAIAEGQTGIYPVESPGGWHVIGKTPLNLFNSTLNPPTLVSIGDSVKFVPIDNENDFKKIRENIENHR